MDVITDDMIREYTSELKILPDNFKINFRDKKCGHIQSNNIIVGKDGSTFVISIRQSKFNLLDFSVIFGVMIGGSVFRLIRYNGDHGEHTNKITGEKFSGCHIHRATKIYQENGFEEEGYAEPTDKYVDWKGALNTLLHENNFQLKNQKRIREWM